MRMCVEVSPSIAAKPEGSFCCHFWKKWQYRKLIGRGNFNWREWQKMAVHPKIFDLKSEIENIGH